ncbi:MAG: Fe-S protein assembly co-chaperone HscB [Saprospiraceae bacterium]|nr:Fe-S protein assembly co-chaperone HscB [Saprospiraceae bacterium]
MNYFEFFQLPVSFQVDDDALRKAFYANSKKYHPDFYTLEPEDKQAEILELSTTNNQAYHTLADFDKRIRYILELKGYWAEEGQNQLPNDFLADMMDINEAIMELDFDFDEKKMQETRQAVAALEQELLDSVLPVFQQFDQNPDDIPLLVAVKDYYLKKRYLLRIKENLSKFASL